MTITPDQIKRIRNDSDLLAFLKGVLGWQIEGEPDIDFYDEPELGQDLNKTRARVRSLVPESIDDEWLILLVEFESRYFRRDLRVLLSSVSRHQRLTNRFENRAKTLFIVTMPAVDDGYGDIQFVKFSERARGAPEIRSFGWRNTFAGRTVCEMNLASLDWSNKATWEAAWSIEALTERFYDEFERVFYDFKGQVSSPEPRSEQATQAYCQLWFNRLLLLAFVERRNWLVTPDGRTDYLRAMWQRHTQLDSYVELGVTADRIPNSFAALLSRIFTYLDSDATNRRMLWDDTPIIGDVPYLNGGLFHIDEVEKHGYSIPDSAFDAILGDEGLFIRFNFTVTESSPLDQVVAIDPEMLGRVFERLVNDRHLEGKYYTPRPIVSFMVDESLKAYLVEKGIPAEKAALLVDQEAIRDVNSGVHFDGDELSKARELLTSIRAVDPACGSGAYLLGLLQKLFTLCYVLEWRSLVSNLFPIDRGRFLYLKKLELVQNCVYGVDLDPTAVSIARLRLWLSLAVENVEGERPRPLPYLDFKVAQGDSLMFPLGANVQATAESELYHEFSAARNDAESADPNLTDAFRAQRRDEAIQLRKDIQSFADVASVGAFPWPIAFEEVFRSRQPGFDVVVANPPYVNSGELLRSLGNDRKKALVSAFQETGSGTADLLVFFFERAVRLLKPGGQLAFITSNKWLKSSYGGKLRGFLARSMEVRELLDYHDNEVFKRVIAYPLVTLAQRLTEGQSAGDPPRYTSVGRYQGSENIPSPEELIAGGHRLAAASIRSDGAWHLEAAGDGRLTKMREHGIPLGEYVNGRIYRGVLTGLNEVKIGSDGRMYGKAVPNGIRVVSKEGVFVIDGAKRAELVTEDRKSDEIIKRLVVGRDIRRWRIEDNDRWIIVTKIGTDMDRYPAIMRHLSRFESLLRPRADQGDHWWELRACAYYDIFESEKLVYQEIAGTPGFGLLPKDWFANNKVFLIPNGSRFLLGILNSSAAWEFWRSISVLMVGGAIAMQTPTVFQLPIPNASPSDQAEIEQLVDGILSAKAENANADVSSMEADIDRRVNKLYGLSQE